MSASSVCRALTSACKHAEISYACLSAKHSIINSEEVTLSLAGQHVTGLPCWVELHYNSISLSQDLCFGARQSLGSSWALVT